MDLRSLLRWTTATSIAAAVSLAGVSATGRLPTNVVQTATLSAQFAETVGTGTTPRRPEIRPMDGEPTPADRARSAFRLTSGSAFSVGPGVLVTNAHVVLRCNAEHLRITVAGYLGNWRTVHEDRDLDLALLVGPEHSAIPPLQVSSAPRLPHDSLALVLGYPVDDTPPGPAAPHAAIGAVRQAAIMVYRPESGLATSFRATDQTGHVVDPTWQDGVAFFGAAQSRRMRWALEIAVQLGHGASGGPVVDRSGKVVGVVVADGTEEGLTTAITLADLTEFLSFGGVPPALAAPSDIQANDWNAVYRSVSHSVVRVGC